MNYSISYVTSSRYDTGDENNFEQPAIFWKQVLNAQERSDLVNNIVESLRLAKDFIQVRHA